MLLVPLGINGFFPAHGRQTACYLLVAGGRTAILLDAGIGGARLAEQPVKTLAPIHLAPWRSSVEAASLIAQMEKKTGCLS